jgi:hypothetical protein
MTIKIKKYGLSFWRESFRVYGRTPEESQGGVMLKPRPTPISYVEFTLSLTLGPGMKTAL